MLAALGAALLGLSIQDADRSGEAELREMVSAVGRARAVRIAISRRRVEEGFAYPEDATFWVDYVQPGVFKILNNGVFGDGELWVSDGKKIMRDRMEESTVEIGDAPASFLAPGSPLQLSQGMPLACALLDGEPGYGTLVAKTGPVTVSREGSVVSFSFLVAGGGKALVEARKENGGWTLHATEFENEAQPGGGAFRGRTGILRDAVVGWEPFSGKGRPVFQAVAPAGTTAVAFGTGRRFSG
ncbi:MAG: hypothetical protein AB7F50_09785 [Fimbriimonadaceae bacterium]